MVDFTAINSALTRTGSEPITSLTDGTTAAKIVTANYDPIKRNALTGHPWKWATKTDALVLLTGTPDSPWLYAYQMPNDLLRLRIVSVAGMRFDYEVQFDKLLCDQDGSTEIIAKYIWDVPEAYWPADFAEAITQELEALFLRSIGERYAEADARMKSARAAMAAARLKDSQAQGPRQVDTSPTLAARRGSGSATSPNFNSWMELFGS